MMPAMTDARPLPGRRAEAARNDERILAAARSVLTAHPDAPVAAVAQAAGVGIGALYRRYRSKDELLRSLALDGLGRYVAAAEAALADDGDPWQAFASFLARCVDMGTSSITVRFAGAFTVDDELRALGGRANEATSALLERTKDRGGLRRDVEVGDLALVLEQLQSVSIADPGRQAELRRRLLALVLDGMRTPEPEPLPGRAPAWREISERYESRG